MTAGFRVSGMDVLVNILCLRLATLRAKGGLMPENLDEVAEREAEAIALSQFGERIVVTPEMVRDLVGFARVALAIGAI